MSDKFEYNYSAPTEEERGEIMSIRRFYAPKDESLGDLERLRRLDKKVKTAPLITSISAGVIGVFTFGLGLTFILEWGNPFVGVIVGAAGIALTALAYPIYKAILVRRKQKYAQEILALADKLLGKNER